MFDQQREIGVAGAHDYLDRLIVSLGAVQRQEKEPLLGVLAYLSHYMRTMRSEVAGLAAAPGPTHSGLKASTDELSEIVAETARAADAIMSAAESVEKLAAQAGPGERAHMLAATARIYEACAFQDITGQRITKVMRALKELEAKLQALADACGDAGNAVATDAAPAQPDLLAGPQLARSAASQQEIDDLLASLG